MGIIKDLISGIAIGFGIVIGVMLAAYLIPNFQEFIVISIERFTEWVN